MIPRPAITAWAGRSAWPTVEQVEQDLLLSRLIVEIANDPYLGDELVFRGGTCLHKLRLGEPLRYSEDLDYVRRSAGGIAELTRAVCAIGERLGMAVSTKIGKHPKIYLRAPYESGVGRMSVKVEVNTFERSPARLVEMVAYQVESAWFTGSAAVQTFAVDELVATKIRALFQRVKGRDLFDLWLALTHLGVAPADLIEAFAPYRPAGYTGARAIQDLREKLQRRDFRSDLEPLAATWPPGYDIDDAGELVIADVLNLL